MEAGRAGPEGAVVGKHGADRPWPPRDEAVSEFYMVAILAVDRTGRVSLVVCSATMAPHLHPPLQRHNEKRSISRSQPLRTEIPAEVRGSTGSEDHGSGVTRRFVALFSV